MEPIENLVRAFVILTLLLVTSLLAHFFGFWGIIAFLAFLILILGYAIYRFMNS